MSKKLDKSEKLTLYKSYLQNLNKINEYMTDLEIKGLKDNITNIKLFFYNHVHISIIDYMNGNYVLHQNINTLNNYIKYHPDKKMHRKQAKQLNMNVFLKELYKN